MANSQDLDTQIAKLNPEQRKAVEAIEGPVLVVAGPGTGKTQMLALRIANILKKTQARPSNILCLTFTEAGVTAMRERLLQMIGSDAYYVRIHTFHGFAGEVIQTFPEKFAFAKELTQLEDLTRLKLMQELIDSLPAEKKYSLRPFHNPYQYQRDLMSIIQNLKREGISPEKFTELTAAELVQIESNPNINKRTGKPTSEWQSNLRSAERNVELSQIYKRYAEKLNERGLYDFEDMILFVIDKFKTDEELLAHYWEKYLYILVDEYQDTNGAQNEIIKLLGSFDQSPNIFAVGDDDQAIYRFQGANVENLLSFNLQFENVQTLPVTINYRSSQLILDLADSIIQHNQNRLVNFIPDLSKHLTAGSEHLDSKAQVYEFSNNDTENNFLVKKLKELNAAGTHWDKMAILYRRHSDGEDTAETLIKAGIPISLTGGRNALDERVIEKLITLLKVIEFSDVDRDFLLSEVMFYDFLQLPQLAVFQIIRYAHDSKQSLFKIINSAEELTTATVSQTDQEKLLKFGEQIISWKKLDANLSLHQFIEQVGAESGYVEYIFSGKGNFEDINSVQSFYRYIKRLNRLDRHIKLTNLLSDIELLRTNNLSIPEQDLATNQPGVKLMTAHAAKGLEFPIVFIIKFYNGNWGGGRGRNLFKLPLGIYELSEAKNEISDDDKALEDERRLLFVALTRAKDQLYITSAHNYPSGNSYKEVVPSQFASEFNPSLIEHHDEVNSGHQELALIKTQLQPIAKFDYAESEREYLQTLVSKFRLSASALNTYLRCPLQFKFDYLLRIPRPTPEAVTLGNAVHFALEHFYRKLKAGEHKDLEYLIFMMQQQLERELLGDKDYQSILTEASAVITQYYEHIQSEIIVPAEIEYGFYGRDIVFNAQGIAPINLSGKLDKIEWIDKANLAVRVVDYKVSNPKSENDIKGKTKKADASIYRQLVFYKLLGEIDDQFRPTPGESKYKIHEATIDFVRPNDRGQFKRVSFEITDEDMEQLKTTIVEVITSIRNLDFTGSEKYPRCGECEYCSRFAD